MKTRRCARIAGMVLLVQFGFTLFIHAADAFPAQLSDEEFWTVSTESSEADGSFRSDNLLSNELYFQYVIPQLSQLAKPGSAYVTPVERYLQQDGIWDDFCRNVATLPLHDSSTFIRSTRGGRFGLGSGLNSDLGNMTSEVKSFCSTEK